MKRRFSRNNNGGLLTPRRAFSVALIGILLVGFFIRSFFPDTIRALLQPLQGMGAGLSSLVAHQGNAGAKERDELIKALEDERVKNKALEERIKELSGFSPDLTGVMAQVISRPPTSPYDVLIVSPGEDAGVRTGMIAYTSASTPLGTVELVSKQSARILLYSAPERVTEGWVGAQKVPVSLIGRGAGAFVGELSKDAAVLVGDGVFIPGEGSQLIGTVHEVIASPSSPTVVIQVRPLTNPFSITTVMLR